MGIRLIRAERRKRLPVGFDQPFNRYLQPVKRSADSRPVSDHISRQPRLFDGGDHQPGQVIGMNKSCRGLNIPGADHIGKVLAGLLQHLLCQRRPGQFEK